MNIVFWLGVVVILFLVWWSFTYAFRDVGTFFKNMLHYTKDEITKQDEEEISEDEER